MRFVSTLLVVAMLAAGCTTTQMKEAADREAYSLIQEKSPEVPGMDPSFSIETANIALEGIPLRAEEDVEDFIGDEGRAAEVGSHVLSLEKALEIAVRNSRDYQSQKETLYLQALALSETRQRYRPVFGGRASGNLNVQTIDVTKYSGTAQLANAAPGFIRQVGELTGAPADLYRAYAEVVQAAARTSGLDQPHVAIQQERRVSGATSFDVDMLMQGGARVAVSLTSNFLRYLTGDPRSATSSALVAGITQPLLGTDRRVAEETLTQAERNLLYSLRSFTRYRQSFSIDVASSYYRVLQARDTVRNNWQSYQAFLSNLARAEAEAETDRITKTELGRTQERKLQSENSWSNSIQAYLDSLDRFKIKLGLPTDAKVVLDYGELERLMEEGLMPPPSITVEDAFLVAVAARLDYYSRKDQLDDAERQVRLAADALHPDIRLAFDARVNSKDNRFQELDFDRYTWNLGLDVDPKFNRRTVRNRYRTALIRYESSRRGFEEFEDNIKLEVRQAWRSLEQARITFNIQRDAVEVGERRVLEQQLKREIGEARQIDIIDAQNALLDARNNLSRALVDHTLAYLRLWLDMGILYVKENGQWEDIGDV